MPYSPSFLNGKRNRSQRDKNFPCTSDCTAILDGYTNWDNLVFDRCSNNIRKHSSPNRRRRQQESTNYLQLLRGQFGNHGPRRRRHCNELPYNE